MGFDGGWVAYPPALEILKKYDYLLTEIAKFVDDPKMLLMQSPLKVLAETYDISLEAHSIEYRIPELVKDQNRLLPTEKIRIGINFDSKGAVKSYAKDLQPGIVEKMLPIDFELYFFGKKPLSEAIDIEHDCIHDYTGKTNILELAALLDQMDLVVCVDSFIAHLSGILGKRTLVLMSATVDEYFSHYPGVVSLCSKIDCAPCFQVGDHCPLGHPTCMAFYHPSMESEVIIRKIIRLKKKTNINLPFIFTSYFIKLP